MQVRREGSPHCTGRETESQRVCCSILTRCDFVPRGHWATSGDILGCHNWGEGQRSLASLGPTSGMLLHVLTRPGQPQQPRTVRSHRRWAIGFSSRGLCPPSARLRCCHQQDVCPTPAAWCSFRLPHPPLPANSPPTFRAGPRRGRSEPIVIGPPDCPHASLATVDPRKFLPPVSVILA